MSEVSQELIRSAMAGKGLDALVCALPMHVLMLTGYWPIMANSIAIFTAREVELIVPADEVENARAYTSIPLHAFEPAALDRLVNPVHAVTEPLIARLRALGLEHACIGHESEQFLQPASYLTMNLYNSALAQCIEKVFPEVKLQSADRMLEELKARKTERTLARLRRGCEVAKHAFLNGVKAIEPGYTERIVASLFELEHSRSCKGQPFDRVESFFFCMSGPNSGQADSAYARTRHRIIDSGDLVMVHCNCSYDGWWTDITRTFVAGAIRPEYQKMRDAIARARDAALASVRPGATGREVDRAAREVLERAGYGPNFTHGAGHGVGYAAANPDGRPRIHPCSDDVLEEGMTFNLEPAIYFKGRYGMRHCDMVAITARGAELLTDF